MSTDHDTNDSSSPHVDDLLETFRPEVDDLAAEPWEELRTSLARDPGVQYRAKTIQRQDQVLRTAMHDVPVPAGLAERLLAELEAGRASDVVSASPDPQSPATVALPPRPRIGRRTWLAVGSGVLALAALAVVLWPRNQHPLEQLKTDDLVAHVQSWLDDPALRNGDNWRSLPAGGEPTEVAGDLNRNVAVGRFQTVSTNLGSGVVYELSRGSGTAKLYVVNTQWDCYVAGSPYTPLPPLTGSRAAGAWQRGKVLYVLVVNPREARLGDFAHVLGTA